MKVFHFISFVSVFCATTSVPWRDFEDISQLSTEEGDKSETIPHSRKTKNSNVYEYYKHSIREHTLQKNERQQDYIKYYSRTPPNNGKRIDKNDSSGSSDSHESTEKKSNWLRSMLNTEHDKKYSSTHNRWKINSSERDALRNNERDHSKNSHRNNDNDSKDDSGSEDNSNKSNSRNKSEYDHNESKRSVNKDEIIDSREDKSIEVNEDKSHNETKEDLDIDSQDLTNERDSLYNSKSQISVENNKNKSYLNMKENKNSVEYKSKEEDDINDSSTLKEDEDDSHAESEEDNSQDLSNECDLLSNSKSQINLKSDKNKSLSTKNKNKNSAESKSKEEDDVLNDSSRLKESEDGSQEETDEDNSQDLTNESNLNSYLKNEKNAKSDENKSHSNKNKNKNSAESKSKEEDEDLNDSSKLKEDENASQEETEEDDSQNLTNESDLNSDLKSQINSKSDRNKSRSSKNKNKKSSESKSKYDNDGSQEETEEDNSQDLTNESDINSDLNSEINPKSDKNKLHSNKNKNKNSAESKGKEEDDDLNDSSKLKEDEDDSHEETKEDNSDSQDLSNESNLFRDSESEPNSEGDNDKSNSNNKNESSTKNQSKEDDDDLSNYSKLDDGETSEKTSGTSRSFGITQTYHGFQKESSREEKSKIQILLNELNHTLKIEKSTVTRNAQDLTIQKILHESMINKWREMDLVVKLLLLDNYRFAREQFLAEVITNEQVNHRDISRLETKLLMTYYTLKRGIFQILRLTKVQFRIEVSKSNLSKKEVYELEQLYMSKLKEQIDMKVTVYKKNVAFAIEQFHLSLRPVIDYTSTPQTVIPSEPNTEIPFDPVYENTTTNNGFEESTTGAGDIGGTGHVTVANSTNTLTEVDDTDKPQNITFSGTPASLNSVPVNSANGEGVEATISGNNPDGTVINNVNNQNITSPNEETAVSDQNQAQQPEGSPTNIGVSDQMNSGVQSPDPVNLLPVNSVNGEAADATIAGSSPDGAAIDNAINQNLVSTNEEAAISDQNQAQQPEGSPTNIGVNDQTNSGVQSSDPESLIPVNSANGDATITGSSPDGAVIDNVNNQNIASTNEEVIYDQNQAQQPEGSPTNIGINDQTNNGVQSSDPASLVPANSANGDATITRSSPEGAAIDNTNNQNLVSTNEEAAISDQNQVQQPEGSFTNIGVNDQTNIGLQSADPASLVPANSANGEAADATIAGSSPDGAVIDNVNNQNIASANEETAVSNQNQAQQPEGSPTNIGVSDQMNSGVQSSDPAILVPVISANGEAADATIAGSSPDGAVIDNVNNQNIASANEETAVSNQNQAQQPEGSPTNIGVSDQMNSGVQSSDPASLVPANSANGEAADATIAGSNPDRAVIDNVNNQYIAGTNEEAAISDQNQVRQPESSPTNIGVNDQNIGLQSADPASLVPANSANGEAADATIAGSSPDGAVIDNVNNQNIASANEETAVSNQNQAQQPEGSPTNIGVSDQMNSGVQSSDPASLVPANSANGEATVAGSIPDGVVIDNVNNQNITNTNEEAAVSDQNQAQQPEGSPTNMGVNNQTNSGLQSPDPANLLPVNSANGEAADATIAGSNPDRAVIDNVNNQYIAGTNEEAAISDQNQVQQPESSPTNIGANDQMNSGVQSSDPAILVPVISANVAAADAAADATITGSIADGAVIDNVNNQNIASANEQAAVSDQNQAQQPEGSPTNIGVNDQTNSGLQSPDPANLLPVNSDTDTSENQPQSNVDYDQCTDSNGIVINCESILSSSTGIPHVQNNEDVLQKRVWPGIPPACLSVFLASDGSVLNTISTSHVNDILDPESRNLCQFVGQAIIQLNNP